MKKNHRLYGISKLIELQKSQEYKKLTVTETKNHYKAHNRQTLGKERKGYKLPKPSHALKKDGEQAIFWVINDMAFEAGFDKHLCEFLNSLT